MNDILEWIIMHLWFHYFRTFFVKIVSSTSFWLEYQRFWTFLLNAILTGIWFIIHYELSSNISCISHWNLVGRQTGAYFIRSSFFMYFVCVRCVWVADKAISNRRMLIKLPFSDIYLVQTPNRYHRIVPPAQTYNANQSAVITIFGAAILLVIGCQSNTFYCCLVRMTAMNHKWVDANKQSNILLMHWMRIGAIEQAYK